MKRVRKHEGRINRRKFKGMRALGKMADCHKTSYRKKKLGRKKKERSEREGGKLLPEGSLDCAADSHNGGKVTNPQH